MALGEGRPKFDSAVLFFVSTPPPPSTREEEPTHRNGVLIRPEAEEDSGGSAPRQSHALDRKKELRHNRINKTKTPPRTFLTGIFANIGRTNQRFEFTYQSSSIVPPSSSLFPHVRVSTIPYASPGPGCAAEQPPQTQETRFESGQSASREKAEEIE